MSKWYYYHSTLLFNLNIKSPMLLSQPLIIGAMVFLKRTKTPWLCCTLEGMKNGRPEPVQCDLLTKDSYPNYILIGKIARGIVQMDIWARLRQELLYNSNSCFRIYIKNAIFIKLESEAKLAKKIPYKLADHN